MSENVICPLEDEGVCQRSGGLYQQELLKKKIYSGNGLLSRQDWAAAPKSSRRRKEARC